MAWQPLSNRLPNLPIVLAGPILRRVTPDSVTVWLALKEQKTVTLEVYDRSNALRLIGSRQSVAVGKNLHIVAVTAEQGTGELVPGQNYTYNIMLNDGRDLSSPGVIDDSIASISYPPFSLPSFSLPPANLEQLRLVHGSCRKPHGPSLDAMEGLEIMLVESIADPHKRPHQLFLTGDQIYADDVADTLLLMLMDAGQTLFEWNEDLPGLSSSDDLRPGRRSRTATRTASFTAEVGSPLVAKSHLFTLAEYCMMYLFAWSDVLWPPQLPAFADVFSTYDSIPDYGPRAFLKAIDINREEINSLAQFRLVLPQVRRALANIPTYMMLDDHEITDDWLINRGWCRNVLSKPLGRRVLQNGLVAFALFQAWGNTPERFVQGGGTQPQPGSLLLEAVERLNFFKGNDADMRREIAHLVGLPYDTAELQTFLADLTATNRLSRRGTREWQNVLEWHYQVSGPAHEVLVLDSRTWRGFLGGANGFPALLSYEGFQEQILAAPPPPRPPLVTIVVAPAPVLGVPLVEFLQKGNSLEERLDNDNETWTFQPYAFERLLSRLIQRSLERRTPPRFVFLSGDVHYGFTARLQYSALRPYELQQSQAARGVFAQLTASSFKNQKNGIDGTTILHTNGYNPILDRLPQPEQVLGWNNPTKGALKIGTLLVSTDTLPVTIDWLTNRNNPALVYPNEIHQLLKTLRVAPDWRYRIDYILAEYEIDDDFRPVRPGAPDRDRIDALKSYLQAADNFEGYAERWGNGKEIVGINNFGELRFQWNDTAKNVVHLIWWRLEQKDNSQQLREPFPLTRQIVSLEYDEQRYPFNPLVEPPTP